MTATPFLIVTMLVFGFVGVAGWWHEQDEDDKAGKALAAFFMFMAVWAAGLLLQPHQI